MANLDCFSADFGKNLDNVFDLRREYV